MPLFSIVTLPFDADPQLMDKLLDPISVKFRILAATPSAHSTLNRIVIFRMFTFQNVLSALEKKEKVARSKV